MWLPSRLYEALPYTYGAVALGGVLYTRAHPLSVVSAILLIAAALYTWLMRREYRAFYGAPGAVSGLRPPGSGGARAASRTSTGRVSARQA